MALRYETRCEKCLGRGDKIRIDLGWSAHDQSRPLRNDSSTHDEPWVLQPTVIGGDLGLIICWSTKDQSRPLRNDLKAPTTRVSQDHRVPGFGT